MFHRNYRRGASDCCGRSPRGSRDVQSCWSQSLGLPVAVLLHNERFHSYLLQLAQRDASESLGVPVHLQNFALNLSNLES
jgi:hypothetical protein